MSNEAILGIAGIIGAIAASVIGFWVGESMTSRRETKQLRREAAEQLTTAWMESWGQLQAIHVQLQGGPTAQELRPDFDHDAYAPMARLGIMGTPEAIAKAEAVNTLFGAAVLVFARPGASVADREAALVKVMEGIRAFHDQAREDVGE